MRSIKKYLGAALVSSMAFLASSVSADQLNVYGSLFESTANVVVWNEGKPVSGGTVMIKNERGKVVKEKALNSHGRAYIYLPLTGALSDYTVHAESNNMTGSSKLMVHDEPGSRREVVVLD